MTDNEIERDSNDNDGRLPYEAPELIDRGDVAKLTQTGINTTGPDAGYS